MVAATPGVPVTVSSDHDLRNGELIEYFAPRLGIDARITYVPAGSWTGVGPDWLVRHRFGGEPAPAALMGDRTGNTYELQASYPCASLSGWSWYLFRRVAAPPGAAP